MVLVNKILHSNNIIDFVDQINNNNLLFDEHKLNNSKAKHVKELLSLYFYLKNNL